jgi:hypothetical protein
MKSFYYLVNIEKHNLPGTDYKHILVAFDDENGKSINNKYITGLDLENFMNKGERIHYEEFFLTDTEPKRVVYWAYSEQRGWCERVEHAI